ncbi:HXXEE domain-containing protein [Promicromonospora sp. NPDC057488]|uniref:HXXEE domain-containing protein n=1 Tax=Promicromonospora sp. NPDC057488 TaxID=3346147 RepID=UPI00366C4745
MTEESSARTAGTGVSDRARLGLFWCLVAMALAVHNAEELARDLPGWQADRPWLPGAALYGDQGQFAVALAIVTGAALVLAVVAVTTRATWSAPVLVCVSYALLVNAAGHVLLSIVCWSLMPGVLTSVVVLAPVAVFLTRALPPVRWTISAALVTLVAALGLVVGSLAIAALMRAAV